MAEASDKSAAADQARLCLSQALDAETNGRLEEALKQLELALATAPDLAEAHEANTRIKGNMTKWYSQRRNFDSMAEKARPLLIDYRFEEAAKLYADFLAEDSEGWFASQAKAVVEEHIPEARRRQQLSAAYTGLRGLIGQGRVDEAEQAGEKILDLICECLNYSEPCPVFFDHRGDLIRQTPEDINSNVEKDLNKVRTAKEEWPALMAEAKKAEEGQKLDVAQSLLKQANAVVPGKKQTSDAMDRVNSEIARQRDILSRMRASVTSAASDLRGKKLEKCRRQVDRASRERTQLGVFSIEEQRSAWNACCNELTDIEKQLKKSEFKVNEFSELALKAVSAQRYEDALRMAAAARELTVGKSGCEEAERQAQAALESIEKDLDAASKQIKQKHWRQAAAACDRVLALDRENGQASLLKSECKGPISELELKQQRIYVGAAVVGLVIAVFAVMQVQKSNQCKAFEKAVKHKRGATAVRLAEELTDDYAPAAALLTARDAADAAKKESEAARSQAIGAQGTAPASNPAWIAGQEADRAAAGAAGEARFNDAVEHYRAAVKKYTELGRILNARVFAEEARKVSLAAARGAAKYDSEQRAPATWTKGTTARTAAQEAYGSGDFVEAERQWKKATDSFNRASKAAQAAAARKAAESAIELAQLDYRQLMTADAKLLVDEFSSVPWSDLTQNAEKADALIAAKDFQGAAEAWNAASAKARDAIAAAGQARNELQRKNRRRFDSTMSDAMAQLRVGNLSGPTSAERLTAKAKALPGFSNHENVRYLHHLIAGAVALDAKDNEKAEGEFRAAREIRDGGEVRKFLAKVLVANAVAARRAEDWKSVMKYASEAAKLQPRDAAAKDLQAQARPFVVFAENVALGRRMLAARDYKVAVQALRNAAATKGVDKPEALEDDLYAALTGAAQVQAAAGSWKVVRRRAFEATDIRPKERLPKTLIKWAEEHLRFDQLVTAGEGALQEGDVAVAVARYREAVQSNNSAKARGLLATALVEQAAGAAKRGRDSTLKSEERLAAWQAAETYLTEALALNKRDGVTSHTASKLAAEANGQVAQLKAFHDGVKAYEKRRYAEALEKFKAAQAHGGGRVVDRFVNQLTVDWAGEILRRADAEAARQDWQGVLAQTAAADKLLKDTPASDRLRRQSAAAATRARYQIELAGGKRDLAGKKPIEAEARFRAAGKLLQTKEVVGLLAATLHGRADAAAEKNNWREVLSLADESAALYQSAGSNRSGAALELRSAAIEKLGLDASMSVVKADVDGGRFAAASRKLTAVRSAGFATDATRLAVDAGLKSTREKWFADNIRKADAAAAAGDWREAQQKALEASQLDPADTAVKSKIATYRRQIQYGQVLAQGQGFLAERRYSKAVSALEQALTLAAPNSEQPAVKMALAQSIVGAALLPKTRGEHAEVSAMAARALQLVPTYQPAVELAAWAAREAGRTTARPTVALSTIEKEYQRRIKADGKLTAGEKGMLTGRISAFQDKYPEHKAKSLDLQKRILKTPVKLN
jgi:hypothetical protein